MAALVKRDANWVPSRREYTLYMRPFMFASEPFLGVRAPQEVDYCVIASPSGPYFPGGVKPVSIWVEDKWFRTGPGGTGFAKCGGNYAASLLGEYTGIDHGCQQVASTRNAPGAMMKIVIGVNPLIAERNGSPKKVPAPRISRISPMIVRPMVNPSPIPIPSKIDSIGPFLDA